MGAESSIVDTSIEISRPMGAELIISGEKHQTNNSLYLIGTTIQMQNKTCAPQKLIDQLGHLSILYPSGRESDVVPILHPPGGELAVAKRKRRPAGETAFLETASET